MAMKWIQGGFNALLGAGALSDTEALATPGAGQSHYITDITLYGGTGTGGTWTIKGGTTTLMTLYTATNGFVNVHLKVPLKVGADKNINITHAASTAASGFIGGFTDRG